MNNGPGHGPGLGGLFRTVKWLVKMGIWVAILVFAGKEAIKYREMWTSHVPDPVKIVLKATAEERALRNMQDPLSLRIYAATPALKDLLREEKVRVMEKIIQQWGDEVTQMRAEAYNVKAAPAWNLEELGLEEAQQAAVKAAYDRAVAKLVDKVGEPSRAAEGAGPGW